MLDKMQLLQNFEIFLKKRFIIFLWYLKVLLNILNLKHENQIIHLVYVFVYFYKDTPK